MVLGSSPVAVTSSEDTLLYFDAIVEPSCQHFDNAVNITSKSYISKFSQVKCSIRSFYCAVLFIGCSAKKTLKSLLHRDRLRKTRETLQISLFGSMFLILVKKTAYTSFLLCCPMCRALCKRRFEPPTSQRISKK